jgi:glycosyltransferase involved in cell wall biosynthesis
MACEVPVIASRVGGIPEVVRDGLDGFLAAVGDLQTMAQRAIQILSEPSLRDAMGKNAREQAEKSFCAYKIILRYEALYDRIISEVRG